MAMSGPPLWSRMKYVSHIRFTAMKFHTSIPVPQRMNPTDFGDLTFPLAHVTMKLTFVLLSKISEQLDRLPYNLVQTLAFLSGYTVITVHHSCTGC